MFETHYTKTFTPQQTSKLKENFIPQRAFRIKADLRQAKLWSPP